MVPEQKESSRTRLVSSSTNSGQCRFCLKGWDPNLTTRNHSHRVFRVHTKIGIISGSLCCTCVTKVAELQISRPERSNRSDIDQVEVLQPGINIPFGRFETIHNGGEQKKYSASAHVSGEVAYKSKKKGTPAARNGGSKTFKMLLELGLIKEDK